MILSNVSASQVDSWDRCQRYWYNRSVLKIPTPQTPAQKRGQDIHSAVETYLREGTIHPEWAGHVNVAIPYLPPPKSPDVLIEQKITLKTFPGGPDWIGYIDLLWMVKLPVKISDHKTTGNFKYVKTPSDLRDNIQMNSYGKWVIDNVDYDEVEYEHIYIGTKEIRSKIVSVLVTRDHINKIWARDVEKVKAMAEVASAEPTTAEELPPTYSACGMYGGCPYRERCHISPLRGFDMPDVPASASVLLKKLAESMGNVPANGGPNGAAHAAPPAVVATSVAAAPAVAPVAPSPPPAPLASPATVFVAPTPPQAVAPAPAAPAGPGKGIWEMIMKDDPVGHTRYNGGFGHTKLPDGTVYSLQLSPEDYAKAEAKQNAAALALATVAAPNATTAPVLRDPVVIAQPSPPFVAQQPQIVPPDAPPRTSTMEEVNAAVNPPTAESKRGRGRPPGSSNKSASSSSETLGKFVQIQMGDGGLLVGLDETGIVWLTDISDPKIGWQRLPPPRTE